jgi:hypothetical protein
MASSRSALIVASDTYQDPQLAQLRAPGRDAEELAAVLGDPAIGDFEVKVSRNAHHYEVRVALEDFFADRSPEDVLLLHFSCHGIKDEAGRLFFAAADTQKDRLNATAIAADYVNDLLNRARSRRVVLLLDCCFSGAFTRGMLARSDPTLDVAERLHGRGRAVLTASGALEYAWEGDELTRLGEPSIFTSAVVQGLRMGEADRDGDQQVSVDELYDFVYEQVRRRTPNQTPGKWSNVEGALFVARNPRPVPPSVALPADLQSAVEDERAWVRAAAVEQLALLLRGPDADLARAARQALTRLAQDDSRRVSDAAQFALGGAAPVSPPVSPPDEAVRVAAAPPTVSAPPRATTVVRPDWLPALVVAGGWVVAWLVGLALASSRWVADMGDISLAPAVGVVGWAVIAPLVGQALRWTTPGVTARGARLIGIGWPLCILFGVVVPFALRLSYPGAAVLLLAVSAAGLLAGLALVGSEQPIPWDRLLVVDAGWCAGWLWSGTTAWPEAFWKVANGYYSTFPELLDGAGFVAVVAGAVLSGVIGGTLMYLLMLRPATGTARR